MRFLLALGVLALACASSPAAHWAPVCDPSRPPDYVPVDLEDCLVQLHCTLDPDVIREMTAGSEDDMIRYHHGLGTGLRNGWGLWSGSRLSEYFNGLGLTHPDDMSGVILTSYWRRLNGRPLRIEEQVRYYQAYWEAHFEPPPIDCPTGGQRSWSSSMSGGDLPDSYTVTYYAECPGDGWFEYTKGADGWRSIGSDPPFNMQEGSERQ